MSQRSDQVAEELRKIISVILLKDLHDPRVGFVTITRIEMTDDLRFAKVYYSVLGNRSEKEATEEALQENMGFIKKTAVRRINMKYAVDIRFEPDVSIDYSFRIDEILKRTREKK